MLLRIDPDQDAIALLSLPRDLKVNIPGYGIGKLNDAYTVGGPKKTLTVVKQLTGININHVVNVDFKGFEQAINAIDCVYVDVDRRYFNSNEGLAPIELLAEIDIHAGYQMLCGDRALQYVRYRHTDNDIVRAARQQDFLREARQKISPARLFRDREELIDIFTKYTTSDIDDAVHDAGRAEDVPGRSQTPRSSRSTSRGRSGSRTSPPPTTRSRRPSTSSSASRTRRGVGGRAKPAGGGGEEAKEKKPEPKPERRRPARR